jgi:hypothetical protein
MHNNRVDTSIALTTFVLLTCAVAACGSDTTAGDDTSTGGRANAGKSGGAAAATAGASAAGRGPVVVASAGRSGSGVSAGVSGASGGRGGSAAVGGAHASAGHASGTGGASGQNEEDAGVLSDAGASASAGKGGATAGAGGSGATATTFTQVYSLFKTSCAGATCHIGATRVGDMLSFADQATAYMRLVSVDAVSCPGIKRVVPGDPDNSELVHTLTHTAAGSCGRSTPRMPDNLPMLMQSDIDLVVSWVKAGALDD